ncbi:peptidoglycan-binding protein [Candidatus Peregrinibacteria bacterium]|nr:peptidoglycan-binding protein [Candidatus Peregrinibacteria bacterium]
MKLKFKVLVFSAFVIGSSPLALAQDAEQETVQIYPYEKTFTITAYYSPIEGQQRYIKGSLAADKKLNGNGTNGADGTPVFPGMIAAPSNIPFGTKMQIPGIGLVSVHDRGGAIVPAGQRGQKHDRLDVWMGSGDEGLTRALKWGKRNVTVIVYGLDENIQESINLEPVDTITDVVREDYGFGAENPEITSIKEKLTKLGYFQGTIDQKFDQALYESLVKFQIDKDIIDNDKEFGAGYFGPSTRKALNSAQSNNNLPVAKAAPTDEQSEKILLAGNGLTFLDRSLELGDSGESVLELQVELKKLNLFGIEPTGYFGEVTANAVFKFQQSQNIVIDKTSGNAGKLDDITRARLAALVDSRIETRRILASQTTGNNLLAKK